jgi:hypothetical protein
MKSTIKSRLIIVGIFTAIIFTLASDVIVAQFGERRRTAIVVSSATHEKDEQAAQQQKTTDTTKSSQTKTQSTTTSTTTTSTTTPPPTPQTTSGALPIGTVVASLPQGCTTSSVDNVEYYHCGQNYYRTAFQGNTLVYVTADPPKGN